MHILSRNFALSDSSPSLFPKTLHDARSSFSQVGSHLYKYRVGLQQLLTASRVSCHVCFIWESQSETEVHQIFKVWSS